MCEAIFPTVGTISLIHEAKTLVIGYILFNHAPNRFMSGSFSLTTGTISLIHEMKSFVVDYILLNDASIRFTGSILRVVRSII
jgi:hypothetical protein